MFQTDHLEHLQHVYEVSTETGVRLPIPPLHREDISVNVLYTIKDYLLDVSFFL